jgi:hypothetical protein
MLSSATRRASDENAFSSRPAPNRTASSAPRSRSAFALSAAPSCMRMALLWAWVFQVLAASAMIAARLTATSPPAHSQPCSSGGAGGGGGAPGGGGTPAAAAAAAWRAASWACRKRTKPRSMMGTVTRRPSSSTASTARSASQRRS